MIYVSRRLAGLGLLLVLLAGCYTTVPEVARPAPREAGPHYRTFADADTLSAYLRYGSSAGPLLSAHRGGSAPGFPENALPSFDRALHHAPALLEVDVRLTQDSALVLLHDETLDRTTTGYGPLSEHTLAEVRRLRLIGPTGRVTPYRVPTLDEALAWARGRGVLMLDVKEEVPFRMVVEAVRAAEAEGHAVVIVYTLEDLRRVHDLAPELMLSATATTPEEADAVLASGVPADRLIAFVGVGELPQEVVERFHAAGVRVQLGTFGEVDRRAHRAGPSVYAVLFERGADVLATDAVALASRALRLVHPAD